jgi:uncharacterized RDD family membrane protein YckC
MKLNNCIKRFIALLIDFLILSVVNFFLLMIIVLIVKIANVQPFNESYSHTMWASIIQYFFPITSFTLTILYFVVMESKFNATLGKFILKLKIQTENGRKISALQAFIRLVLMVITSIAGIGFIFYLFSNKNQFLHDWLTKTYVE